MADRLGVDLAVEGFSSFDSNMTQVNKILDDFAKKVQPFSEAASAMDLALRALSEAAGFSAGGLTAFNLAMQAFSRGASRTLKNLPERLSAAAAAMSAFGSASTGAATGVAGLVIPAIPAQRKQAAAKGPQLNFVEDQNKMLDFMLAQQQKADQQIRAMEEKTAVFRQRLADRRIADDERIAASAERFAQKQAAIDGRVLADRAKAAQKAATTEDRSLAQLQKTRKQQAGRDIANEVNFTGLLQKAQAAVGQADATLRGRLADALLNKGDEAELKNRIGGVVADLQAQLTALNQNKGIRVADEQDIAQLRQLQAEIKRVTQATTDQIAVQRKALQVPSVAFLARERARDAISELTAMEFATGKIAQAARSANPIIRTFARTIFAIEDASAAAKLSTEAFGIVMGKVLGTLKAISLPVRLLAGALNLVGINAERATGPFAFFLKLAGFKGAAGIAEINSETQKLGETFKRLNLSSFDKQMEKIAGTGTKKAKTFRTLGADVARVDFSTLAGGVDPAAAAERGRQAVAAVFKKAEGDRSRSGQREAVIAAQTQATIEQIQQAGTSRVEALTKAREQARETIQKQASATQTNADRQRLAGLVATEQQIGSQIAQTQARTAQAITAQNQKLASGSKTAAAAMKLAGQNTTGLNSALEATGKAANNASAGLGKLGTVVQTAIGVGVGQIAVNALRSLSNTLGGLLRSSVDALGSFEAQILGLQTLARREILDTDSMITFAEAEVKATEKANELFDQLQQLAIISPFETEDLTTAFALAESYDFTSTEALKLTTILTDFAAGTGKTAQSIELITQALGQVRSAGRLTGEEFRQLRAHGVPVLRALSEATGKSSKEINEFLRKGGTVSADTAIGAIAKVLSEEFAGAAQKSQLSVRGLISSLNDLKSISLRNVIQPVADELVKPFAGLLTGTLNSENFQNSVKALGQSLSETAKTIVSNVGGVIGTLIGLFEAVPKPVREIAANFLLASSAAVSLGVAFNAVAPVLKLLVPLLGALFSTTGLLIGVIATLAAAWQSNWFNIQGVTQNAVTAMIAGIQGVPEAVMQLVESFTTNLPQIPQAVNNTADQVIDIFANLVEQMFDFGSQMVQALAEGVIGAIGVVIDAFGFLGDAITGLLEANSPPKLLPDIGTWGMATADAWLQGWTEADFDIFSTLTDNMQKALNSIDPDVDAGEIRGIQTAVADVLDVFKRTGAIDTSFLGTLGDFPKDTVAVIQRLAQATLEAAVATSKYENAQKELKTTTDKFAKSLEPVEARIKALSDQEAALDETTQASALTSVLENRFATEEQKRRAAIQLQKVQAEQEKRSIEGQRDTVLAGINERIKASELERDLAQETLDLLQERFDLQFQFAAEAVRAAGGGGGESDREKKAKKKKKEKLGELIAPGLEALADLKLPDIKLDNKIAPAIADFQKRIEEGRDKINQTVLDLKNKVTAQFQALVDAFNLGLAGINDPAQTGLGRFANQLGLLTTTISTTIDTLKSKMGELRAAFAQGFAGGGLAEQGKKGAEEVIPANSIEGLAVRAGRAARSLDTAFGLVVTSTQKFVTNFSAAFEAAGAEGETNPITKFFAALQATGIQDEIDKLTEKITGGVKEALTTGLNNLFGAVGKAGVPVGGAAGDLAAFAANIYNAIGTALGVGTIDVEALRTNVKTAIENLFSGAAAGGQDLVATVTTKLDLLFGTVTFSNLSTSFDNLATQIGTALKDTTWGQHITKDVFGGLADAVTSAIKGIFGGVTKLLQGDVAGASKSTWEGLSGFTSGVGQALGGVSQLGGDMLAGVDVSKITGAIAFTITTFVSDAITNVIPMLTTLLQGLTGEKSLLKTTAAVIGTAVAGIVGGFAIAIINKGKTLLTPEGIKGLLTDFDKLVETAAQAVSDVITGFIEGIIKAATVTPPEQEKKPGAEKMGVEGEDPLASFQQALDFLSGLPQITQKAKDLGVWMREELKKNTDVDLGAITGEIERTVIGNLTKTWELLGVLFSELPAFLSDLSTSWTVFVAQMELADAQIHLAAAKTRAALAGALDTLINSVIDSSNQINKAMNDLIDTLSGAVSSIPGVGEDTFSGLKLPELPNVDLSFTADAQVTNLQKVADDAKANLETILAATTITTPPLSLDPVQVDQAGKDTAAAYDASLQSNFVVLRDNFVALGTEVGTGINEGAKVPLDNSTVITDYVDILKTQARVQSPSQLTHDELGLPMGQGIIQGIKDAFALSGDLMAGLATALSTGNIQTSIQSSVGAVTTAYQGMATNLKGIFNGIKVNIVGTFSAMTTQVVAAANDMADQLREVYDQIAEDTLDLFNTFFEDMDELFTDGYENVQDLTEDFSDTMIEFFSTLDEDVRDIITGLVDKVVSEFRRLARTVPGIVDDIADDVRSAFEDIRDDMGDLAKAGVDAAIDEFNRLAPAIDKALDDVITNLSSASRITNLKNAAKNIGAAIIDGIILAFTGSGGNSAVNRLADAIVDVVNRSINVAVAEIRGITVPNPGPSSLPLNPFRPGTPIGIGDQDGKLTDIWSALIGPNGDGIGTTGSKMLSALLVLNEHLLGKSGTSLATAGFSSTLASVSPGGPIVIQSGDITNINTINIAKVSERQANRLASSFNMFQRMNP